MTKRARETPEQNQGVEKKGRPRASRSAGSSRSTAAGKRSSTAGKTSGKNKRLGKLGEDMAGIYLEDNGFEVIERNWSCAFGEADIIATEESTLVFIEVKTRSESYHGLPEYAVTAERRARYEKIAIAYLSDNRRPSGRVRFDVIAIKMTGPQQCVLRHHRDAFGAGE
jgi:putative endonuclease